MSAQPDRPSSAGSIKRSNAKIPAEGLVVLPPEPGLVKFESMGISRPSSSAESVRAGSAGRVERSLQFARKKELEDESPRRNSAESHVTDLKLAKQEGTRDAQPKETGQQTAEDSESSDTDSSDSDDKSPVASAKEPTTDTVQAPVELKGEFLKAVMDEEYEKAKELCQKILLLEPDNKTCSEFHAVICEKMKQDDEVEDGEGDDDDDDDDDDDSTEESDEYEESDDDVAGEDNEDDDDDDDDDDDEDDSDSDDDFTLPPGPINLIMGGLPIRPQNR